MTTEPGHEGSWKVVRALPDTEPVDFSGWSRAVRSYWITDEIAREAEE